MTSFPVLEMDCCAPRAQLPDQGRGGAAKVPKLRYQTFETAIIERYRRRESSVEEALIEMYLAGGLSARRPGRC
jgi:transposase-like protein